VPALGAVAGHPKAPSLRCSQTVAVVRRLRGGPSVTIPIGTGEDEDMPGVVEKPNYFVEDKGRPPRDEAEEDETNREGDRGGD